jgi:hypothetical protein
MLLGAVFTTFDNFSTSTAWYPTRRAMAVCLDRQFFYVPPVVAGPELASRGLLDREGDRSAAIFGVPSHPPLPQNAHDPQRGGAGGPQANAILIPDDEFDLDCRSDTSFGSLGGLLPGARNNIESCRVTGTGMCLDLAFLGRPTC